MSKPKGHKAGCRCFACKRMRGEPVEPVGTSSRRRIRRRRNPAAAAKPTKRRAAPRRRRRPTATPRVSRVVARAPRRTGVFVVSSSPGGTSPVARGPKEAMRKHASELVATSGKDHYVLEQLSDGTSQLRTIVKRKRCSTSSLRVSKGGRR